MRVLLQANTWTYSLFSGLWDAMHRRGHHVICDFALPEHTEYFYRLYGKSVVDETVGTCRSWVLKHLRSPLAGEVLRLEQRLGLRLSHAWISDIHHYKFSVMPHRPAVLSNDFFQSYFVTTVDYYHKLLDMASPDWILFEGPNGFTDKILFALAQERGIPALTLMGSQSENFFCLAYGDAYRNLLFEDLFWSSDALPEASCQLAREYIISLRTLVSKEAFYNRDMPLRFPLHARSGFAFTKKLFHAIGSRAFPITPALQWQMHILWQTELHARPRYAWQKRRNEKFLRKWAMYPQVGDNFAAYYMQYQPESTTSANAPYFINQNNLCEALAISMPADCKLYVKEHKSSLGDRGQDYYHDLLLYPNVRLITPNISGMELAHQARWVATITGTIGFEAIALNKPVLIFGDVFYDFCPWIYKVKNLEDLSKIVPRLCKMSVGHAGVTAEADIERFFSAYFASMGQVKLGIYSLTQIAKAGEDSFACDQLASELERLVSHWIPLLVPYLASKRIGGEILFDKSM